MQSCFTFPFQEKTFSAAYFFRIDDVRVPIPKEHLPGTNVHVVLQEAADAEDDRPAALLVPSEAERWPLCLSAASEPAIRSACGQFIFYGKP